MVKFWQLEFRNNFIDRVLLSLLVSFSRGICNYWVQWLLHEYVIFSQGNLECLMDNCFLQNLTILSILKGS